MVYQVGLQRCVQASQCRNHVLYPKNGSRVVKDSTCMRGRGSVLCRGQETKQTDTGSKEEIPEKEFGSALSEEQLAKIAELQKRRDEGETEKLSWWQGAIEEAQLVNWPPPGKAAVQTILVIGIVASTSVMLFGLNTALADLSRWYYSLR